MPTSQDHASIRRSVLSSAEIDSFAGRQITIDLSGMIPASLRECRQSIIRARSHASSRQPPRAQSRRSGRLPSDPESRDRRQSAAFSLIRVFCSRRSTSPASCRWEPGTKQFRPQEVGERSEFGRVRATPRTSPAPQRQGRRGTGLAWLRFSTGRAAAARGNLPAAGLGAWPDHGSGD